MYVLRISFPRTLNKLVLHHCTSRAKTLYSKVTNNYFKILYTVYINGTFKGNKYKITVYLRNIKQIFNSDFFSTWNLHQCDACWSVFVLRNPECYNIIRWWPCKISVEYMYIKLTSVNLPCINAFAFSQQIQHTKH